MDKEITKKHKTIKKVSKYLAIFLLMWISFGAGIYFTGKNEVLRKLAEKESVYLGKVTGRYSQIADGKLSQDVDFKLFWDVWDTLKENYVDDKKLEDKKMLYGAIRGMVASVGDPYTVFMDPVVAKEFGDDLAGKFEGIGAEIGIKNDILTIISPLPDMPAEKAGIRAGDRVLAINGTSTAGIFLDDAVNRIRGPKDSKVVLTINRDGVQGVKEYSVTRGTIVVKSVRTEFKEKENIFVIKITGFNEDTEGLFKTAVIEAVKKNPKGLILDLRNDPGGFLETAISVSSEWVDKNIVVTEKHGDTIVNQHLSVGRPRLKGVPTVVLVNQGSASASEIVAGALQDYGQATIVGMKTFGKGSVQSMNSFNDGSSVKITVAKWYTPKDRSINEHGIDPDYQVDLTLADYQANKDPQTDVALRLLQGQSVAGLATSTKDIIKK